MRTNKTSDALREKATYGLPTKRVLRKALCTKREHFITNTTALIILMIPSWESPAHGEHTHKNVIWYRQKTTIQRTNEMDKK